MSYTSGDRRRPRMTDRPTVTAGRQQGNLGNWCSQIHGDRRRPVACERPRRDLITCYGSGAMMDIVVGRDVTTLGRKAGEGQSGERGNFIRVGILG